MEIAFVLKTHNQLFFWIMNIGLIYIQLKYFFAYLAFSI